MWLIACVLTGLLLLGLANAQSGPQFQPGCSIPLVPRKDFSGVLPLNTIAGWQVPDEAGCS